MAPHARSRLPDLTSETTATLVVVVFLFILWSAALIEGFEVWLLSSLQTLFDSWGWLGVAAIMAFENATGITPSEVTLGLAGWLLLSNHGAPFTLVFVGGLYAALGSLAGASLTYWIARLGGRPLIDRLARRLRLNPRHILAAEAQFHRRGASLVLLGRMIPSVRTLISIPAGLARMPYVQFALFTFAGAYLWCSFLIGAGYILGKEWMLFRMEILDHLERFAPYGLAILLACLLGWLIIRELHRRRKLSQVG